jgi:hypothetical protein
MTAQHTPGPWSQIPQSTGGPIIAHKYETGNQLNPIGLRLVGLTMARKDSLKEDEANARLMAAAPDLLSALRMVLDDPSSLDGRPRTYEAVRAAIKKAEGDA